MSSRVYKMVRNVDLHVPEKSLEQFTRNRRRRIYEFAHQMEQLCVTSRVKWKEKLEVLRNNHGTHSGIPTSLFRHPNEPLQAS